MTIACGLVLVLACRAPIDSLGDPLPPDDSPVPAGDDSSSDDSAAHGDDSSAPDDSSVTSGDIEWTLIDSTGGPITHQWAVCHPHDPCEVSKPEFCDGAVLGIVASQHELTMLYAESLSSIDYVPEIDFSSHMVVWSYLCCCTSHGPWLVVDDVTRVETTLELAMHVERWDPAPAAFGRPWVVVQVPIGDYDSVVHNLY